MNDIPFNQVLSACDEILAAITMKNNWGTGKICGTPTRRKSSNAKTPKKSARPTRSIFWAAFNGRSAWKKATPDHKRSEQDQVARDRATGSEIDNRVNEP